MSRYGYDFGYQGSRERAMMRAYDGDHRFIANDLDSWNSRPFDRSRGAYQGQGRQEQFGRGYDRGMSFHPSDSIPRRMGSAYSGYDRQQGYYNAGPQQPRHGNFNRGYDRSSGYDFNAGYGGRQGSNWQEIYRQVDQPRWGAMTSPWQSHIPGVGMRPSFPYGMTRGGGWF